MQCIVGRQHQCMCTNRWTAPLLVEDTARFSGEGSRVQTGGTATPFIPQRHPPDLRPALRTENVGRDKTWPQRHGNPQINTNTLGTQHLMQLFFLSCRVTETDFKGLFSSDLNCGMTSTNTITLCIICNKKVYYTQKNHVTFEVCLMIQYYP